MLKKCPKGGKLTDSPHMGWFSWPTDSDRPKRVFTASAESEASAEAYAEASAEALCFGSVPKLLFMAEASV